MKGCLNIILGFIFLLNPALILAQLSPGDLSASHSNLEGISNCTKCHVLGNKLSGDKCLACHTEIYERITAQKGYHSSVEVKGKECISCHSEHNGKDFELVRLDVKKFDHSLTGYRLSEPHSKADCKTCHIPKNIIDQKIRVRKNTWLGVQTSCLTCHNDYHRQTLPSNCLECHFEDNFKPASKFNHDNSRFKLAGRHKTVECSGCHKTQVIDGKNFQEFRGIEFSNCTSCHVDPHQNKFGQNCRQCHTEESFHIIKNTAGFDHNKTAFKLEGKHQAVDCNKCHKTKYTDPLKHDRCTDCHNDYHYGQFTENGRVKNCSECHSVNDFTQHNYTLENHNQSKFVLRESHTAVPCFECHKKEQKWSFRSIGINCSDCHRDIHKSFIDIKYYAGSDCSICHKESRWDEVSFDHSTTGFLITGAHKTATCRDCHFKKNGSGIIVQSFNTLNGYCTECHSDNHNKQFEKDGKTDCTICHATVNWKATTFDHNKTAFRLDGKHANLRCTSCHKPQNEGSVRFTLYKIKDFRCEACHY